MDIDNNNEEAKIRLSEGINSLPLVASSSVVEKLMEYHDLIKTGSSIDKISDEWSIKHDVLLTDLVKKMREDLHGSKRGFNKNFPDIHLTGKKKQ